MGRISSFVSQLGNSNRSARVGSKPRRSTKRRNRNFEQLETRKLLASDLFISEYLEGSSNNKAIEFYNNSPAAIDLSGYSLERFTNGSSTASATLAFSDIFTTPGEGTLAPGETFVIANPGSNALILGLADLTSGVINHNGDDAYQLLQGTTIVDTFGVVGVDPGSAWTDGAVSTANQTLRRKPTIVDGNVAGFDPITKLSDEWDTFAIDTSDGLGTHNAGNAGLTLTQSDGSTFVVEGGTTDTFEVVLNLAPTADVTLSLSTTDGETSTNVPSLVFTAANWDQPQTVTVTAVDDGDFEGAHSGTIGFTASSSDPAYNGLVINDLAVSIADNDAPPANSSFVINEVRVNAGGSITDFAEIFGDPSTSTAGLYLVFISGEFEPGQIDAVIDLSSGVSDANGFLLATNSNTTVATDSGDVLQAGFSVFGSPQTVFLVEGFTGLVGDDLDVTNDGSLDTTPWIGSPFDSVSLVDGDQAPDFSYSATVFGPDGNFTPSGIARDVDGTGNFVQLAFGNDDLDTPGSTNSVVTIAATTDGDEAGPVNGVFTVSQVATKATDTVISYSVGGTATSGDDFVALSGTVTILAGNLDATITVPVIDDSVVDLGESLTVTLTAITSGDPSLVLGNGIEASINIADNDFVSTLSPGDLVINEIMQNPSAVFDSNGEYFELWNTTGADIDINGFVISDFDGESHTISNGGSLIVPANGYLVLAINSDPATNGGIVVGYEYSGFNLSNGADEIVIADPVGTVIDTVAYDGGPTFPDPAGASMELILGVASPGTDNDTGSNWQTSTAPIAGSTDFGTPGSANIVPVGDTTPPTITDVKVASSGWSTLFKSTIDTTSSEGLSLPGADQLKNLTWFNLNTIIVEFSEDVQQSGGTDIDLTNLSIAGVTVADYEASPGLTTSYSDGGGAGPFKLTISLNSGSFGPEKLLVTINDTVQDVAGNLLDGEWTDSSSTTSGDTFAGGNFAFRIDVLPGDVSNDDFLLGNDTDTVSSAQFTFAGGAGYDPFTDANGDGFLLGDDTDSISAAQFTFLPSNEPVAPSPTAAPLSPPALENLSDSDADDSWAYSADSALTELF
ncbi:MAG: lamin tail domain-containing protein [Rubripirellula sp.]